MRSVHRIYAVNNQMEIIIGDLLRYYRKLNNNSYTQEEIAQRADINEKYYGRIERNESMPTVKKFFALCKAVQVEPAQVCFALSKESDFKYLLLDGRQEAFTQKHGTVSLISKENVINEMFEELYYTGVLKGYMIYGAPVQGEMFESYRCDYYFPEEKTIVVNKAIMEISNRAIYPSDKVEHVKCQLESVNKLLKKGYKVKYNIFILSPGVNTLVWNKEIKPVIEHAEELGMQIMLYYLCYDNGILKPQAVYLQQNSDDSYDIVFV